MALIASLLWDLLQSNPQCSPESLINSRLAACASFFLLPIHPFFDSLKLALGFHLKVFQFPQISIFIQKINIRSYLITTETLAYLDQCFHLHKYSAQSGYLKSFNQR